jgi:hypothetical protein
MGHEALDGFSGEARPGCWTSGNGMHLPFTAVHAHRVD